MHKSPIYQTDTAKDILITAKQPFEFIDSQSSSLLKGHLTLANHTQLISPTRVPMDNTESNN